MHCINSNYVGCGTVFKITPAGKLTTLHDFCSLPNCADGSNPREELIQAADGNLYGTTPTGGTFDRGTVFKITPASATSVAFGSAPASFNIVSDTYLTAVVPAGGTTAMSR
jgi:uncharacterized repeat protein (TIGR03803 family)